MIEKIPKKRVPAKYEHKTWRQCGSKNRYKTEKDARKALRIAEEKRNVKLDYYFCLVCNGWHLTSRIEGEEE